MSYDYETLYDTTPDALGARTPKVIEAVKSQVPTGCHVLDIGCGQGRDALHLARSGYRVTGIDMAPSGIRDLNAVAAQENLPAKGIVADLLTWDPEHAGIDAALGLLCDRTLHMLHRPERETVLARLLKGVAQGGYVFIIDEAPNIAGLRDVLDRSGRLDAVLLARKGDLFVKLN